VGRGNLIDGSDDHYIEKHLDDGTMVLCEETKFPARRLILVLEHATIGDAFWAPMVNAALVDWAQTYPQGEMPVDHVYQHAFGTTIQVIAPGMREGRPSKADDEDDTRAPQTVPEIVGRLRALAVEMFWVGTAMDYFGGFTELAVHGRELVGAAAIACQWADSIEQGGA